VYGLSVPNSLLERIEIVKGRFSLWKWSCGRID
jgi:hypothetical protein